MKASEFIKNLTHIVEDYGDLEMARSYDSNMYGKILIEGEGEEKTIIY